MRFKAKKSYGEYKVPSCAFCGKIATRKNETGVEVCYLHTQTVLEEIKCTCGSWLEQRSGKFGSYFNCAHCGNINAKKAFEMKEITQNTSTPVSETKILPRKVEVKEKKETIISSRDVEYFD